MMKASVNKLLDCVLVVLFSGTQGGCSGRPMQSDLRDVDGQQTICVGPSKLVVNGTNEAMVGTHLEGLPTNPPSSGLAWYFRFLFSPAPQEVVLQVSTASTSLMSKLFEQNVIRLDDQDLRVEISSFSCSIWTRACKPTDFLSANQNDIIKGWLQAEIEDIGGKKRLYGTVCAEASADPTHHSTMSSVKLYCQPTELKLPGAPGTP